MIACPPTPRDRDRDRDRVAGISAPTRQLRLYQSRACLLSDWLVWFGRHSRATIPFSSVAAAEPPARGEGKGGAEQHPLPAARAESSWRARGRPAWGESGNSRCRSPCPSCAWQLSAGKAAVRAEMLPSLELVGAFSLGRDLCLQPGVGSPSLGQGPRGYF